MSCCALSIRVEKRLADVSLIDRLGSRSRENLKQASAYFAYRARKPRGTREERRRKERKSGERGKRDYRGETDDLSSNANRHFTKYKAETYCLQVLHRRQSAGRYGGRLIGLLRPDSILRFRDAAVCEAKRGGRCYVSLATTRLAAPCSAALTARGREERKKERRREKERETEKERARERPVQFEHSKSRWLVPTVSLGLAACVCRASGVATSFGSELTRSALAVYISVPLPFTKRRFATRRHSRNIDGATRSPSRVGATWPSTWRYLANAPLLLSSLLCQLFFFCASTQNEH